MQEQDAREILDYFLERVQPTCLGTFRPMILTTPGKTLQSPEHLFLVPVDGAKRARTLYARLVSELGVVQQLPFPRERGEISCGISTLQPSQFKLNSSVGTLWGINVSSNVEIGLPNIGLLSVDDVVRSHEESLEAELLAEGFADEDSLWEDESEELGDFDEEPVDPVHDELGGLVEQIAVLTAQERGGLDLFIAAWSANAHDSRINTLTVAIHGFKTSFRANTLAKKVVSEISRINSVSLIALDGPNVNCCEQWQGSYSLLLSEHGFRPVE